VSDAIVKAAQSETDAARPQELPSRPEPVAEKPKAEKPKPAPVPAPEPEQSDDDKNSPEAG
jgi:hypothetical protein